VFEQFCCWQTDDDAEGDGRVQFFQNTLPHLAIVESPSRESILSLPRRLSRKGMIFFHVRREVNGRCSAVTTTQKQNHEA
jgi:hypothetical protein